MVHRITDLDAGDRPRERLAAQGAQALSAAELLAILIRTGTRGENAVHLAQTLLRDVGGLVGLQRTPFDEMCRRKGLGRAKAAQIKAAIELGRRISLPEADERPI
ncbi:MAG: UPF0758 domain-containing protein, partial [Anaerolineales bacterium]